MTSDGTPTHAPDPFERDKPLDTPACLRMAEAWLEGEHYEFVDAGLLGEAADEIERLREALREIENIDDFGRTPSSTMTVMRHIARTALGDSDQIPLIPQTT